MVQHKGRISGPCLIKLDLVQEEVEESSDDEEEMKVEQDEEVLPFRRSNDPLPKSMRAAPK